MATALIQGMIGGGMEASAIGAYDVSTARMDAMRAIGVKTFANAVELADACDMTVLAVKPKDTAALLSVLNGQAEVLDVLSIVTGWTQKMLEAALPKARGIARCMPNTPALVREGVIALASNHSLTWDRFDWLQNALASCGRTVVVTENLFDAVTGVSGSGPAYVYVFIEALADAGVRQGLARDTAYTLAAQTLLGAAKMVLETGEHPGALKDAVCSPGGTTIEAIYALEKAGLRGAVMDAVDACVQKAAKMGK